MNFRFPMLGRCLSLLGGHLPLGGRLPCLVGMFAVVAAFAALWRLGQQPSDISVPDGNGFYVWQRHWSDKVEAVVCAELEAGTHDLYVLGGELEYENGLARWRGANVPGHVWLHDRITAVFRLPVQALDNPGVSAARVISHAGTRGVHRIQLDVDVPERMIGRYAELVEGIRRRWPVGAGKLRLGATFLPCHLGLKEVRRVLAALDEPVIQLHGIDAPKNRVETWALMKRRTVFRALRAARALDGRFKMALPSYAYVLTFNADGGFRRLYAEGLPDNFDLPPGTVREIAVPDLDLLHEIFTSPLRLPVIWFRLPVRGADRWCLERETLSLLERGERPRATVEFTVRRGGREGTVDLIARYRHQIPLLGVTAAVDWGTCGMEGEFFPLNGCRVMGDAVHGQLPVSVSIAPFACGEPFLVGKAITGADPRRISMKEKEKGK